MSFGYLLSPIPGTIIALIGDENYCGINKKCPGFYSGAFVD
jgi:hypothetical protein